MKVQQGFHAPLQLLKYRNVQSMKELYLLGYSPVDKEAWAQGKLTDTLQPLDIRHGVFPNLVMTPLLSTACKLPSERRLEFLDYVERYILCTGKSRRRYNVLHQNVGKAKSNLDPDVANLVTKRGKGRVYLVFSYWATTALLSFLIQGKKHWDKKDLKRFGTEFIQAVRESSKNEKTFDLPNRLPANIIPRHGLLFRILTTESGDKVDDLLGQAVIELGSKTHSLSPSRVNRVVSTIRSIIPLPHNEVYQNYKKGSNPIGKYQACFVECKDSIELESGSSSKLMWDHVGSAIAEKIA